MCIIIKRETQIIYPSRQIDICPECRGTGLEYEYARLLWERKEPISQNELIWLIVKKLNTNSFLTDYKTEINFPITQGDIYQILKLKNLWVPCKTCMGRGVIHNRLSRE